MIAIGFGFGKMLGWSSTDSIFLGALLSISSTTIIIKSLEELGLASEPFAQLMFAILVVEDLLGILILVGLSTLATDSFTLTTFLWAGAKLTAVVPRGTASGRVRSGVLTCLRLCLLLVVFRPPRDLFGARLCERLGLFEG